MQDNNQVNQVLQDLRNENDMFAQAELKNKLVFFIRHLLMNDFAGLVQLLYKVDVNEELLKSTLAAHPGRDAAELVSELLVQRELQKRSGKNISNILPNASEIPGDEKW